MKIKYILLLLLAILLNSLLLTNNCVSQWDSISSPNTSPITSLAVSGTNIFAATDNGIYISANNGSNWSSVINGITNMNLYTLSASGSVILAGAHTYPFEVYMSTNNGNVLDNC